MGLGTKPVNAILNVTSAGNIGIDIKSQLFENLLNKNKYYVPYKIMFLCEIGRLLMAKIGASANNLVFTKGNISLLSEKNAQAVRK